MIKIVDRNYSSRTCKCCSDYRRIVYVNGKVVFDENEEYDDMIWIGDRMYELERMLDILGIEYELTEEQDDCAD